MALRDVAGQLTRIHWGTWIRGAYDYNIRARRGTLPPKILQVVVNYRCNARCAMCNIWRMKPRRELSLDEFANIMEDDIFQNIERLTLTGGETSLRQDLGPLADMFLARMSNLKALSLITNGFLPERILAVVEHILRSCQARGVRFSISVSLDGVGEMHDRIRGVPGAFDRVVKTLEGLKDLRRRYDFWMGVGYTVMHQNLHHVPEFRAWCEEQGIPYGFQVVGFHEAYVSNLDRQNEVDFRPEDRDALIALMEDLASQRSWRNVLAFYWDDMMHMYRDGRSRQTPCPFALEGLILDSLGDVYYCLSSKKIGNVIDDGRSVSDLYYDPENLAYREYMRRHICPRCNSACAVGVALKKDIKRYARFLLTGRTGPGAGGEAGPDEAQNAAVPASSPRQ
ncbi:MAG: radical SAM protein [Anaerolineae bacterium]|nr:radical SAM protein [Anaerolineae bacterium]